MKITITFKDPDAVFDAITEAVEETVPSELDSDEQDTFIELRRNKMFASLNRWIQDNEDLTVTFDTVDHTATVKESR